MKLPIWFSAGLITASVATAWSSVNRFLSVCLAAFLTIIFSSPAADAQTDAGKLNPAEKWIFAQVKAGEIADLSKQFPDEDKRKLSAHFLEDLLMGMLPGIKLHRHGVRISGAIIDEPVDLENAQIPCEVWLEHCQFNANATFNGANFAGTISFENSAFKADAAFDSMKVGGYADFSDAVFEGLVNFVSADIASNFEANGAKFQNKEKDASFSGMKVRGGASFKNAVFDGPVNFGSVDITGFFDASEAQFQNKEKEANFSGIKVGRDAVFNDAVFEGPVNFVFADIAGNFVAIGAKFQNKEKEANFNSMKVRGYAKFKNR